jgi:hypothetical protein
VNQLRIEEELVMVPHDATAAEFAQDLDDGIRSRSQRRHIAKTDDLVHAGSADFPPARRTVRLHSRGYLKSVQYASSE